MPARDLVRPGGNITGLRGRSGRVRRDGTYRIGGEFAVEQQLSLDLRVDAEDLTHFDSGLVAGGGDFPSLDIPISVNGGVCFDTVIDLHAFPADGVTGALPVSVVPASTPNTRIGYLAQGSVPNGLDQAFRQGLRELAAAAPATCRLLVDAR